MPSPVIVSDVKDAAEAIKDGQHLDPPPSANKDQWDGIPKDEHHKAGPMAKVLFRPRSGTGRLPHLELLTSTIVTVLVLAVGLAAESSTDPGQASRPVVVYLGPSIHQLPASEYADYMAQDFGMTLEGQSSSGGLLGILYPRSRDRGISADLVFYGVKSDPTNLSYQVIALEVGGYFELLKGLAIRAGGGPAFINEKRQAAFLQVSDSIVGWPFFLAARYGRAKGFFELRFRPLTLLYANGSELKIGGLFLVMGVQLPLGG